MNESLLKTNNEFKDELETWKNKVHKMELKLKISENQRDNLQKDLDQVNTELKKKVELESLIENLEMQVANKNDGLRKLEEKMQKISLCDEPTTTTSKDDVSTTDKKVLTQDIKILQAKLQRSREKVSTLEEEKAKMSELSESKISSVRLEYEGKLEKMKNKMVSFICQIL